MERTPEKIKKGLEVHALDAPCVGSDCPYNGGTDARLCTELIAEDALSYILQLEATIAEMEKVGLDMALKLGTLEAQTPKWISVEDRMPDESNVIEGSKDGMCSDLVIVFVRDDTGNSFTCDDITVNGEWVNYPAPIFEVTHWMPLPEPPKEA